MVYDRSMETPPASEVTATEAHLLPPYYRQMQAEYDHIAEVLSRPAAAPVAQPKVKKRRKVEPAEGSRLSALMAELPRLEAEKTESEIKLKEHKKKVQAEIAALVTDPFDLPDVFDIPADPYGAHPAYTLSAREGAWRLNTEAMKVEEPETYVKWAERGDPYWELRRVQKNRVSRG